MATAPAQFPKTGTIYLWCVTVAGAAITASSLATVWARPFGYQWFLFAGLTLFTGSFTVKVPSLNATISVSETFVCACVLMYGPAAGVLTLALDALIMSVRLGRENRRPLRLAFNMAVPALAVWPAAHLFFWLVGAPPGEVNYSHLQTIIAPLFSFATVFFLVNSGLIAIAIGYQSNKSAFSVWRGNLLWLGPNYYGGASVASLIVAYTKSIDFGIVGIIVPLLLISYLTFRTTMGRLEDAHRHVAQMNSLYMSTIQTLAMAIDAKDQVTHGHVRRVQTYAMALAKALGVNDERQLRAIEAAALLHDTGKLAVPEHILNKPGKLTPEEFKNMKLHADVGADILAAIPFPFPVVPIVRHHHENWDGTGYPAGLSGADIPIGARILAVVDCFDALTSDRPYRGRLSREDAFRIIAERKGKMYDPLAVDTFVELEPTVALPSELDPRHPGIEQLARAAATEHTRYAITLPDISADLTPRQATTLDALLAMCRSSASTDNNIRAVVETTRTIVPADLCAVFENEPHGLEVACVRACGLDADRLEGLRIPIGHKLTGWVAATQESIQNSDPVLDLEHLKPRLALDYKSCIAAAIVHDGDTLGAISAYSIYENAFGTTHRLALEYLTRSVAPYLRRSPLSVRPDSQS